VQLDELDGERIRWILGCNGESIATVFQMLRPAHGIQSAEGGGQLSVEIIDP